MKRRYFFGSIVGAIAGLFTSWWNHKKPAPQPQVSREDFFFLLDYYIENEKRKTDERIFAIPGEILRVDGELVTFKGQAGIWHGMEGARIRINFDSGERRAEGLPGLFGELTSEKKP